MKIQNLKIKYKNSGLFILIILNLIPTITFGESTEITNSISTEANTDGNRVQDGGTVTKGSAEASVEIQTEVSGEKVENTEIKIESDGEVKEFSKVATSSAENGKTIIETKIDLRVDGSSPSPSASVTSGKGNQEKIEVKDNAIPKESNVIVLLIKTVVESIKSLFSWFI